MQIPITQNRDKETTEYLYTKLRELPHDIEGVEEIIAVMTSAKREAQARLEDAELNALLSAPNDGKNEAARELQRKAAIAQSPDWQAARKEIASLDDEIEQREAEAKARRREFQASLALTELHAARINAMYRIQQIQQNTNHKDNTK